MKDIIDFANRSNNVVALRLELVDVTEDLNSGLLLSQILYWYLPDKDGNPTKLCVRKDGHYWLAKSRKDWWEECRLTEYQYDTAIKKLEDKNLVERHTYKFDGAPTTHIRLKEEVLNRHLQELGIGNDETSNSEILEEGNQEESEVQVVESPTSLTETTTDNTTKTTSSSDDEKGYVCYSNKHTHFDSEGSYAKAHPKNDKSYEWANTAAVILVEKFLERGIDLEVKKHGKDETIVKWEREINNFANEVDGIYSEEDIKDVIRWLVQIDDYWIGTWVFNSPKAFLHESKGGDTYFDQMYRNFKVWKAEKARMPKSPY